MPRIVEKLISDSMHFSDHAVGVTVQDGKPVGISETPGRERCASADFALDGTLSYSLSGKPSHGEDGTIETCGLLTAKLNSEGGHWGNVAESKLDHTDALIHLADAESEESALHVQVVRAVINPVFWAKLSKSRLVEESDISAFTAASLVFDSVNHKAEAIPRGQRGKLVLALNGIETPFVCFPRVVLELIPQFGSQIRDFGFAQVWLVGSVPQLVSRLDVLKPNE